MKFENGKIAECTEEEVREVKIKLDYRTCNDEDIRKALKLYVKKEVNLIEIKNLYPGWFAYEYNMEIDEHNGYDMDWWGHFYLDSVEIPLFGCCMYGYIRIERED